MKSYIFLLLLSTTLLHPACDNSIEIEEESIDPNPPNLSTAAVTAVQVSGEENAYTFNITVRSLDTGCDQYADWWEIVTPKGELIYRRILAHSHVDEQPFTRSGGTVKIRRDQEIYVRAHMNTSGYGTTAFGGTVVSGFIRFKLQDNFALDLGAKAPLPNNCAF